VHIIRFVLDVVDNLKRSEQIDVIRPIADLTGNVTTILFVIAAAERLDKEVAWIGGLLGVMLVLREIKYRIIDDFVLRAKGNVTTSQGGTGVPSGEVIAGFHAFFGRYIKSLFYVIIGFALIYMSYAVYDNKFRTLLYDDNNDPHLVSAVIYSVRILTRLDISDSSYFVYVTGISEYFVAILMAWVLRTVPLPKRR
jgi:hypothetical protein